MNYNPITDGLLKAIRFLAEEPTKKANARKPKFRFEQVGEIVHMSKCVKPAERQAVADLIAAVRAEPDETERKRLMAGINQYSVRTVTLKRATPIDYSRYTGEKLRQIRAAGGSAKEQARAARRATKIETQIAAQ